MNDMNKFLFLGLLIGIGFSCSVKTDNKVNEIGLPDSLFSLKNIENADLVYKVKYIDNKLYLDSSKRVEFVALDTTYKLKILAPILKKDLGVDKDYVKSFLISYFISKQDKIGDYQPLIIWTSGDDYTSLILTLVDSTLNPVSHFVLNGGLFAGPYEINDSLTSWGEDRHSKINGTTINTYSINTYVWTDSRNDSAFVDSIIYKSQISQNGLIKTEKIDSIRMIKRIEN
jgi:hypothetical protein